MNNSFKVAIITIILIAGSISLYLFFNQNEMEEETTYRNMEPVLITSEAELSSFIQEYDFQGDGSENNPYIINYIRINTMEEVSFQMENTRSFVIIENTDMFNASRQNILFWNVRNVVVQNNFFHDGLGDAIYVNHSRDVEIRNNEITEIDPISNGVYNGLLNFPVAVDVQYSTNVNVRHNYIHDTYDGIWFWGFNNNSIIEGNRIENIGTHGLGFGGADNFNVTILDNYINDVTYAMWLLGADGNSLIQGNTIIDAFDGIRTYSNDLLVQHNYFQDIRNFGILMEDFGIPTRPSGFQIFNNTFNGVKSGAIYIQSVNAINNTVLDNNFIDANQRSNDESYLTDNGSGNIFMRNYYSDFVSVDDDGDGFYDTGYSIDGIANNEDLSPRVSQLPYNYIEY